MNKPTWILVADRARARLFEMRSHDDPLIELEAFVNPDGRGPDHDRVTERAPRVNESATPTRHAIEPHTTLREKSADRFARQLHGVLEHGRVKNCYDQLVLVALPQFLGTLHSTFGKQVREHFVAEVPHELTTRRGEDIRARLPKNLLREALNKST